MKNNRRILKIGISKFVFCKILDVWNFRNFEILSFSEVGFFGFWDSDLQNPPVFSILPHEKRCLRLLRTYHKRCRNVRDRHTKPVQLKFRGKQSTLKVDDFLDFREIFTTGSAPRVIRSTSLLLALRSSRRPQRPPEAAWAAPDDKTQCLISPQCPRNMSDPPSGPGGRLGCPQTPHRAHGKKTIP